MLSRQGEAAVIDVGSNSIRLVAYRIDGRAFTPFLNEKVMAGLGRGLGQSLRLNPAGVEDALEALGRFRVLLDSLDIRQVFVVATAAVREAADGPRFVEEVQRRTGFKLKVLQGEDEARLAAAGVHAGAPDAEGMVGDLGGTSLELIEIDAAGAGQGETYALGPLALAEAAFDAERVSELADVTLAQGRLKAPAGGGAFFAVGGAWRAFGRVDMHLRDHPIHVLHHHAFTRDQALEAAAWLKRAQKRGYEKALERIGEAVAKRADTLPYAAIVMERVLEWGGFDEVILSSHGVREGVLAEQMAEAVLRIDPLIASAEAFGASAPRARAFGQALGQWIAPVRVAAPSAFTLRRDATLWEAAARLSDVGAALHPDQRASLMFDLIVRAPLIGVTHPERTFLAAAIHHRYTKKAPLGQAAFDALLAPNQRHAAAILGAALRLGADLSGRGPKLLQALRLVRRDGCWTIEGAAGARAALTQSVVKRLDPLSELFGQSG
jgi:exopolyphosphatase/guanosine-5'-triphosphate,3'-diphosphate pyrophosphatase